MTNWINPPSTTVGSSFSRPTTVYLPQNYRPTRSYKLVLMLHHYASTGTDIIGRIKMDEAGWYGDGAIILAPTGSLDAFSSTHWNYWDSSAGDFAYLTGIVDEVIANFPIDTTKVFLMGYSNGGLMAHELVKQFPSKFTACFTYSASPLTTDDALALAKAVPTACWHGDADGTVLYAGDASGASLPGSLNGHGYVSADGTDGCVDLHAQWNGIAKAALPAAYDTIDLMTTTAGNETSRFRYTGSASGTAVEHWQGASCTHTLAFTNGFAGFYPWAWLLANHRATR
jgi:polyhydroxybutyrate depolymerase